MPVVGFSPRKTANVLYGAIDFEGADALLATLGRHTTGKGCLYIKKQSPSGRDFGDPNISLSAGYEGEACS